MSESSILNANQSPLSGPSDGPSVQRRITPFGWMCLAAIPALASTLWWQSGGTGAFLSAALLCSILWSWLIVSRDLQQLQAKWLIPGSVYCHEATTIGCHILSPQTTGPLSLQVFTDGSFTHLARVGGVGLAPTRILWTTRFSQRGLNALPPLSAQAQRPFGMLCATAPCATAADLMVLPALGQIRPESLEQVVSWLDAGFRALDPGHDEVAHLRPYRFGDSMRTVHWRATARMRSVMVTERHAPHAHKITICLDNHGPQRHSSRFERLVCAAATTIAHFIHEGWQVTLIGPWIHGAGIGGNLDHLLEHLAVVQCNEQSDCEQSIPRNEACLVFTLDEEFAPSAGTVAMPIPLSKAEQLVRMGRHIR